MKKTQYQRPYDPNEENFIEKNKNVVKEFSDNVSKLNRKNLPEKS